MSRCSTEHPPFSASVYYASMTSESKRGLCISQDDLIIGVDDCWFQETQNLGVRSGRGCKRLGISLRSPGKEPTRVCQAWCCRRAQSMARQGRGLWTEEVAAMASEGKGKAAGSALRPLHSR